MKNINLLTFGYSSFHFIAKGKFDNNKINYVKNKYNISVCPRKLPNNEPKSLNNKGTSEQVSLILSIFEWRTTLSIRKKKDLG